MKSGHVFQKIISLFAIFAFIFMLSIMFQPDVAHADYGALGDPYSTGCAYGDATHRAAYVANSYVIAKYGITIATVENWYSPKCVTNWGQIEWTGGKSVTTFIRAESPDAYACFPENCVSNYSGGLSPSWTNMVSGTEQVCIYSHIYWQNQSFETNSACA